MAVKTLSFLALSVPALFMACTAEEAPSPSQSLPDQSAYQLVDQSIPEEAALVRAEIATVGMDHLTGAPIVLLRDLREGRPVPIWIGIAEAQAIMRGMHDIAMPRPMTHDLLLAVIEETGFTLKAVTVHSLRQGTYLAALTLENKKTGEEQFIDSRPSDALALAIRTNADIFVAEEILLADPDFEFVPPPTGEQVVRVAGLTLVSQPEDYASGLGIDPPKPLVKVRSSSGFAAEFGIRDGDILLRSGEVELSSPNDFFRLYLTLQRDETLPVTLWRDGTEIELELPRDDDGSGDGIDI